MIHPCLCRVYARASAASLAHIRNGNRDAYRIAVQYERHWWLKLPEHVRVQLSDPMGVPE